MFGFHLNLNENADFFGMKKNDLVAWMVRISIGK